MNTTFLTLSDFNYTIDLTNICGLLKNYCCDSESQNEGTLLLNHLICIIQLT